MKKIVAVFLSALFVSGCICDDNDFSSDAYQKLTRQEKFDKIWVKIEEKTTPNDWYSAFTLGGIFFESMNTTFDYYGDSFPSGRKKLIHTVGVVGLVEFQAVNNPYTGVFQGCSHAILRLSVAKEPDFKKKKATEAFENFTPGFGIKFLRDGVYSANTVAMFGVNGQPSWDFFQNEFSTHIPEADGFALKLLNFKFSQATKYTTMMGNKDIALYDQYGNISGTPHYPYKLTFKPGEAVKDRFPDYFQESYITQLQSIPRETILYEVYAHAGPERQPELIGKLVTKTKFTSSYWGDTQLWIRHNRFDEDLKEHPEWTPRGRRLLQDPEFQKEFKEKYGFAHP